MAQVDLSPKRPTRRPAPYIAGWLLLQVLAFTTFAIARNRIWMATLGFTLLVAGWIILLLGLPPGRLDSPYVVRSVLRVILGLFRIRI